MKGCIVLLLYGVALASLEIGLGAAVASVTGSDAVRRVSRAAAAIALLGVCVWLVRCLF